MKCQVSETLEADIIEVETDSSVTKDCKEIKLKHEPKEQQELSPKTPDENDEEETLVKIRMSHFCPSFSVFKHLIFRIVKHKS